MWPDILVGILFILCGVGLPLLWEGPPRPPTGALSACGLGAARAQGLARAQGSPRTGERFQVCLDSGAWEPVVWPRPSSLGSEDGRPGCVRRILSGRLCFLRLCWAPWKQWGRPLRQTPRGRLSPQHSARGNLEVGRPSGGGASWESRRCCWPHGVGQAAVQWCFGCWESGPAGED